MPRGSKNKLKANYELADRIEAPLNKGQTVGTVFFELDGEVQLELPLVALETVEEGGMWSQFTDYISLQMDDLFD